jgi:hypothetical protein
MASTDKTPRAPIELLRQPLTKKEVAEARHLLDEEGVLAMQRYVLAVLRAKWEEIEKRG